MKRCVIYSRISTQEQQNSNQILQLTDYAEKQGWDIVEVVTDVASGGKSSNERAGLKKVFEMAHKKKFDVLLFFSLDRLSREGSRKTIEYLTRLDDYKIDWHSYTEQYLSSIGVFKDCIISLLSTLARQEKIRISERTKAGLERTVRINGTKLGRRKTPKEKIAKAKSLRESGLTYSEIGLKLGVTKGRAHQIVNAA